MTHDVPARRSAIWERRGSQDTSVVAEAIAGDPFPMLTPAIYISVYMCFTVLGLTFAITAWRTRNPQAAPRPATQGVPS